ncbi:hypothetical protein [Agromyces albus]|uniref:Uncharacterized protein n=1 Tax=Agromyces albus TaxID=205332 RepID=A0A4Q2KY59_9MICO|nr:hypothetical protein [Agromyces albus]RXZ69937.1 hypothetical protein ESP51_10955 [Agromyces albus]
MVTLEEARSALERHFAEHPPAIAGELYIAEWYEDDSDYLPVWGAREFLVEGREAFGRWDNMVIFIDKQSGEIREDVHTLNLEKIEEMRPVAVSE